MRRGNGRLALPPEEPGAREGEGGAWGEERAAWQRPQDMLDSADRIRLLALEGLRLKQREDLEPLVELIIRGDLGGTR